MAKEEEEEKESPEFPLNVLYCKSKYLFRISNLYNRLRSPSWILFICLKRHHWLQTVASWNITFFIHSSIWRANTSINLKESRERWEKPTDWRKQAIWKSRWRIKPRRKKRKKSEKSENKQRRRSYICLQTQKRRK